MTEQYPSFLLVFGYTMQIPVAVMPIVYLLDLANKYGYVHPVSWAFILAFTVIAVHAGFRLARMLFTTHRKGSVPSI
jgi:hypothetical protein